MVVDTMVVDGEPLDASSFDACLDSRGVVIWGRCRGRVSPALSDEPRRRGVFLPSTIPKLHVFVHEP